MMPKWERAIIYPLLFLSLFAALGGFPGLQAEKEIGEEVFARRIVLLNQEGQEVVEMRTNPAGGGRISLRNAEGTELISIGETSEGSGVVAVFNKDGDNPMAYGSGD